MRSRRAGRIRDEQLRARIWPPKGKQRASATYLKEKFNGLGLRCKEVSNSEDGVWRATQHVVSTPGRAVFDVRNIPKDLITLEVARGQQDS